MVNDLKQLKIYPWNERSMSSRILSKELGCGRIRHTGSTFVGNSSKVIINWGASIVPETVKACKIVNLPAKVALCTDKLKFFKAVVGKVSIPPFTQDADEALDWVNAGELVMARTKLQGSGGEGIVFFDDVSHFVQAKLFTKYIKKKEEFRVHVAFGKPIFLQRKALRTTDDMGQAIDPKTIDFRVRNHANGFIFQHCDIKVPEEVVEESVKAVKEIGLHFGAVDTIWNEKQNKAYVLEVNCAPGLEGETIKRYVEAFQENVIEKM